MMKYITTLLNILLLTGFCFGSIKTSEIKRDFNSSVFSFLAPHSLYSINQRLDKINNLMEQGKDFEAIREMTTLENAAENITDRDKAGIVKNRMNDIWQKFWGEGKNTSPQKTAEKQFNEMQNTYPNLMSKLLDNEQLAKLLEILSESRMKLDYKEFGHNTENFSLDKRNTGRLNDRIQYALDNNLYISLGQGVYATPVSGSFRRHILFQMDAATKTVDYNSAVEIKMPGELEGKRTINPKDFDYAKTYQTKFTDNTISEVLFLKEFSFTGKLYEQKVTDDVNIIVNRYTPSSTRLQNFYDDKNYSNIRRNSNGIYNSNLDANIDIINKVYDLVARMHGSLGMIGRRDMHIENFTLSQEKNSAVNLQWVNDFAGFRNIFDSDHLLISEKHLSIENEEGEKVKISAETAYQYRAIFRDFQKITEGLTGGYIKDAKKSQKQKELLLIYLKNYNKYAPENMRIKIIDNEKVEIKGVTFPLFGRTGFFKKYANTINDPEYLGNTEQEAHRIECNVMSAKLLFKENPDKFSKKYKTALEEAISFFTTHTELSGDSAISLDSLHILRSS